MTIAFQGIPILLNCFVEVSERYLSCEKVIAVILKKKKIYALRKCSLYIHMLIVLQTRISLFRVCCYPLYNFSISYILNNASGYLSDAANLPASTVRSINFLVYNYCPSFVHIHVYIYKIGRAHV